MDPIFWSRLVPVVVLIVGGTLAGFGFVWTIDRLSKALDINRAFKTPEATALIVGLTLLAWFHYVGQILSSALQVLFL